MAGSLNGRVEHLERLWGEPAPVPTAHDLEARRHVEADFRRLAANLLAAPAPPDPAHMSPIERWTWESVSHADDLAPRDTDDWRRVFWHGVDVRVAHWAEDRRARQQQAQQAG